MTVNITRITMRKMLFLCLMSSVVRCQQPKRYSAQEGGQVQISCPYDPGYENSYKLFYQDIYAQKKLLIQSDGKTVKELTTPGKYHLHDDTKQRILNLTIRDLNLNDGGTYWCYIDTLLSFDPKTEIELTVHQKESSSTTLRPTPMEETHKELPALMGNNLYLVVAAVFLPLSLFAVLLLKLRKYKHDAERKTCSSRTSGEAGDQHHTEDLHLLYSTVYFHKEGAAHRRGQTCSATTSTVIYATVRRPET